MPKFHPTNLSKATPRKYKLIGNVFLIIGGGLSASLMTLPTEVIIPSTKIWLVFAVDQVSLIGKLLSSMFAIEEMSSINSEENVKPTSN